MGEQLSRDAERVLEEFRQAKTPPSTDEAWNRFRGRMHDEQEAPVVTRAMLHRRHRHALWRAVRRGLVVGGIALTAIVVVDRVIPHFASEAALEDAQAAYRAGDAALAYDLLVDHSKRYPTKTAAESRMGLLLDVLCSMGRADQAEQQLQRYLDLVPDSSHRDRAEQVCPNSAPESAASPDPMISALPAQDPEHPLSEPTETAVDEEPADPVGSIHIEEAPMVVNPASDSEFDFTTVQGAGSGTQD